MTSNSFPVDQLCHFKVNKRYKRVGYSMDTMRRSACLVVNPIMVDSYGFLFNCTTMDQASDLTRAAMGLSAVYECGIS